MRTRRKLFGTCKPITRPRAANNRVEIGRNLLLRHEGKILSQGALLTSSMSEGMPQAIEVVGQAEQQGLADLGGQAASGCARGEFAFDGREDAFDLGALAVRFFRKGSEHLIPNGAIRDTPAPRGNDALGSQALPNVLVVGFGVKLRICEHHTDRSAACRHIEQSRQSTRVAPGPLTGALR